MYESTTDGKRLLLVDGNSIINRAYFALAGRSSLTAPDGTPTGALNTYLNTLFKYIDEVRPTHICTLFDRREKTFRHDMFDGYKAKRKGMPDDLAAQMPLLKEALDALNIPRVEMAGFEADDLIGTLARRGEADGYCVYILSGDKDDFQLIDENTVVLMPVTKAGRTTTETYDLAAMAERYELTPEEFITLKAIMGDPSDNIPGVKGIGEKGAKDLVQTYRTLDEIYVHLNELSSGLQKKLTESREMAYLSYELSKIRCDAPIEESLDSYGVKEPDAPRLADFLRRLGLRALLKRLDLSQVLEQDPSPKSEQQNDSVYEEFVAVLPPIEKNLPLDVFSERFVLAEKKKSFSISLDMTDPDRNQEPDLVLCLSKVELFSFSLKESKDVLQYLSSHGVGNIHKGKNYLPVGHQMKNRFRELPSSLPFASVFDTEIAGYLLNQIEGSSPSFEMLFEHAVKLPYPKTSSATPEDKKQKQSLTDLEMLAFATDDQSLDSQSSESRLLESAWRAYLSLEIATRQMKEIEELSLNRLVYDIEMPLVLTLDNMERKGVFVDAAMLDQIHTQFERETHYLTEKIYELSQTEFNISSPKQLGQVLFEKLGLASGRKNSSGSYSTDSDELTRLIDEHPVIREILNYRQITKLDSTFVVGLRKVIDEKDHRVHSNFSQAMTNTGRLSSSEPNLQNIPIRSHSGSQIRKAFIAPPGYVLLDADYSQIELRLLAHLSGDENMIRAFLEGEDIHTNTAANIFGVRNSEVQPYMRAAAKTVNFSIVYGISDFGLSTDLGVSFQEAHRYIEQYDKQYPRIREYLDSLKKRAYDLGYVETMFGRRRVMKELKSPNRNLRMFGERAAMNTPVQGTAADIIKIAMVRVAQLLTDRNLDARLILQVHDELIIECKEQIADEVAVLLQKTMEEAISLSIPLIAEVSIGANWYECKNG